MNRNIMLEDSRNSLLAQGRRGAAEKGDGKTRYQKRTKSKLRSNVRELNKIDFNLLFKDNILTVGVEVQGETDDYLVTISFGGLLDELQDLLSRNPNQKLDLRTVVKALVNCFNKDNIYFRCTCADFQYRHSYWASKNNLIVGDKELRPSDETNPDNSMGPACKHIMLVLSNSKWVVKLASVIYNYINYIEKHYKKLYADVIYPAVYGKKYEEPVQLSVFDKDELDTDSDTIDASNKYARDKNKFKPGNKQGIRFTRKNPKDTSLFDIEVD